MAVSVDGITLYLQKLRLAQSFPGRILDTSGNGSDMNLEKSGFES